MSIIGWIVVGAIAGGIGNYVMKGGFGLIGTIILGIVGAMVGGAIGSFLFGGGDFVGWNWVSLLLAAFGGIIVVGIAGVFKGSSSD